MIRHTILLALLAGAVACTARNSSNTTVVPSATMITRTVPVSAFSEIEASRVKVVYTPGPATGSVTVTAPDNVMEYVEIESSGDALECGLRSDIQLRNSGGNCVTVTVTAPNVNEFEASLSAEIEITGEVKARKFSAETSTSGSIICPKVTVTGSFEVDANTSGSLTITTVGADEADIEASTSGHISISQITVHELNAEASTSGSIRVSSGTAETADYDASTSGSLHLEGVNARRGKIEASTSGTVNCNVATTTQVEASTGGSIRNSAR